MQNVPPIVLPGRHQDESRREVVPVGGQRVIQIGRLLHFPKLEGRRLGPDEHVQLSRLDILVAVVLEEGESPLETRSVFQGDRGRKWQPAGSGRGAWVWD